MSEDVVRDPMQPEAENVVSESDNGRTIPERRYPRDLAEAGELVAGTRLDSFLPALNELRDAAIADLGGIENVPTLKLVLLDNGLKAIAIAAALEAEIQSKARKSTNGGYTPAPSNYKATAMLPTFWESARRAFLAVGLKRVSVRVDLAAYLAQRQAAQDERAGSSDGSATDSPAIDAAASERGETGMSDEGNE